jgi:hypothetical protein
VDDDQEWEIQKIVDKRNHTRGNGILTGWLTGPSGFGFCGPSRSLAYLLLSLRRTCELSRFGLHLVAVMEQIRDELRVLTDTTHPL